MNLISQAYPTSKDICYGYKWVFWGSWGDTFQRQAFKHSCKCHVTTKLLRKYALQLPRSTGQEDTMILVSVLVYFTRKFTTVPILVQGTLHTCIT